ncbi:MAG: hypothetical protein IIV28_07260 [Alistipes sp.]|nr:hypothetical protein [Alistipes sp.]
MENGFITWQPSSCRRWSYYVTYDPTVMTLIDAVAGDWDLDLISFGPASEPDDNGYVTSIVNFATFANIEDDGVILTLTFEVAEEAEAGDYYFAVESLASTFEGVEYEPIGFEGTVAITDSLRGDINMDNVVTIADAEGVFAIIYCRYNPNTVIGSTSLAFAYPESAQSTDHSSLVELTEGDLYQSYYTKYSAPVYHLTYTTTAATMSMLTGLTESYELDNEADKSWLSYEYSEEWQMVVMKAEGNGKTGAIVFKNILGENKLVLLCTLNLAK